MAFRKADPEDYANLFTQMRLNQVPEESNSVTQNENQAPPENQDLSENQESNNGENQVSLNSELEKQPVGFKGTLALPNMVNDVAN